MSDARSAPFPEGLTTRPAQESDLAAVTALFNVSEIHDAGEVETTEDDIEAGWSMPDFDLALDSVMVLDEERPIAYADAYHWRADATVHPADRGRGIGTALVAWTEATTLARRSPEEEARIGQTIIDSNVEAADLFTRSGYTPRHTSWVLHLPPESSIVNRALRDGYSLRRFDPDREKREVFQVVEDAFNEWPTRTPSSFEKWQLWVTDRDVFRHDLSFVAVHRGRVVGASMGCVYPNEGWVQQLAVEKSHRHQGLGKALLGASFEAMRAGGLPKVGLSTDSRTGALDLYLDIGMEVTQSYTHYSKLLRPAP